MQASTHPEDIKAALRKRFGSLSQFERDKGLPIQSARDVLRGKSVTRTAEAIAAALNTNVHELFPGRFRSPIRDDDSNADAPAHRLNAGAR